MDQILSDVAKRIVVGATACFLKHFVSLLETLCP